jgi:hypothetical protein
VLVGRPMTAPRAAHCKVLTRSTAVHGVFGV